MRASPLARSLDWLVEACWLLALVAVPIFFDTMTVRIFEPDKIVLFRNIVLVMVVALCLRAIAAAPAWLAGSTNASDATTPRRGARLRSALGRRPLLAPVVVFGLIYTIATMNSVLPGISFWGSYDRLQGLYTWLTYVAFFLVLVYRVRTWPQVERIVSAIVFASVPAALYGTLQHLLWDPVLWGANTSVRVSSTLGNAIFLGAYLLMCMPFAAYRLWLAVERWRQDPSSAPMPVTGARNMRRRPATSDTITIGELPPIVPVIGYAVVLLVDFAALYFTGSRGPYYGFAAACLVVGFPLTVKFHNPFPAIASIALFIVIIGLPQVLAVLPPVVCGALVVVALAAAMVALLRAARSRGARALAVAAGAALVVAIVLFPQAIADPGFQLGSDASAQSTSPSTTSSTSADAQHLTDFSVSGTSEVRKYIWEGSLHLIAHRPILGWGPETMIYVYSPYYPSGLGHIERANAAPDRNHDEELDFLVFSGVFGLAAWLALLATFAVVAARVWRRATSPRAVFLIAVAFAVVVGHLVEGLVGIGVVSTLMLLWTMFALATILYARPALLAAGTAAFDGIPVTNGVANQNGAATDRRARPANRRAESARTVRSAAPQPLARGAALDRLSGAHQGVLVGLIVGACAVVVGAAMLFTHNVNVVRADAAYKQGQAYDQAGGTCLFNPSACPVAAQGASAQQLATYAGTQLIPNALNYFDQATNEQPNQDMYYLWKGKTYLDEAQYYLNVRRTSDAVSQFQLAEQALQTARALNPYNADHPMNLARMFTGWSGIDPGQWALADRYYRLATTLARHNGRWSDEWGRADMRQAQVRAGLTTAARRAIYLQALAAFKHACQVDDLLGDARALRGDAYAALGMTKDAAASYREALAVGNFEPQATGVSEGKVVQSLIGALFALHDYRGLVRPVLGTQSPITLAYSPTVAADFTPGFTSSLQSVALTLRQKGYLK